MNNDHFPLRDELAIKEAIHHWFAFFEGETVPTYSQLALFDDEIELIHAGQHLLAKGKEEMQQWLDSIPPEFSSHFVEEMTVERVKAGIYQVSWQTPYQSIRENGAVGGAIIRYQTLVRISQSGVAKFVVIQKTPFKNNPETVFHESFREHRASALSCRLQRWLESNETALPATINALGEASQMLLNIQQMSGDKKLSLQSSGDGENPGLLMATEAETYYLSLQQQPDWYPVIASVVAIQK
ncbi:hypothetical protein [Vibrio sp. STUT-A11]|uniref:hypothetical protein n=1 Tax=unclassified Vibrio TaxID=2614977 RepID=UPI0022303E29|nr:hypothetical protein [Vibrio sp. STUT-A11]